MRSNKKLNENVIMFSANLGHDPQTLNGSLGQQQNQCQQAQVNCKARKLDKSGNSTGNGTSANGWGEDSTACSFQRKKGGPSGGLGDDEDGGGGGTGLEGTDAEEDNSVHLKRRVGLVSGVALIVGTMIGSGCYQPLFPIFIDQLCQTINAAFIPFPISILHPFNPYFVPSFPSFSFIWFYFFPFFQFFVTSLSNFFAFQ